ncbi:hypothetical protein ASPCAL09720 [Aspergillus calidoustus]|uniref:UDP-glucose/GDP-mannose dehydrogenase N-terminal domain-containing protein n=1 Tax=Aspergillus calidoustus TaxID=454130 RepID=A0A0U5G4K7_ASPCI|nr:hypothetical protein ASPCAL09720 [Aspergillus calidoustus]
MIVIIPILVILVGVAMLLRRQYMAHRKQEGPPVVANGQTYSEVIESKPACVAETNRVGDVRQCCIIGAGRVGATTGIVLASNNPEIQFRIVDTNERLITAWTSHRPPITDPGLEDILFDDECLALEQPANDATVTLPLKDVPEVRRRQKLQNLSFSSDVHDAVEAAQVVFLCVEMGEFDQSFAYLDPILETIAAASKGPKILVQRSSSPYGMVRHIIERLESLTPGIHHTILTIPWPSLSLSAFAGHALSSPLSEPRVIIGHIYSPSSRPEDIDALKRLYTPFVPAERIVTMDAYSAELGQMGQTAMLAHQIGAMASLGVLSEKCEASTGAVGWMLGFDTAAVEDSVCGSSGLGGLGVGGGFRGVGSEVMCLVSLAKELGMEEVAEYWGSLLKMQEFLVRRAVKGLVQQLETDEAAKKAAITITVLGFDDEGEMGTIVVKELRSAGLNVKSLGDGVLKNRVERELGDGIEVVESIEAACLGSSGVVLLGATATRASTEAWQEVVRGMRQKKLLTLGGRLDGVKMKQLGFEVV